MKPLRESLDNLEGRVDAAVKRWRMALICGYPGKRGRVYHNGDTKGKLQAIDGWTAGAYPLTRRLDAEL